MTSPAHVPAPTGLPTITFYVDFVSPYAWLAFTQLPQALEGLHYQVRYRPVLLGALLQAHGNPGPAGVTPKRAWTLRHAAWAVGPETGIRMEVLTTLPGMHLYTANFLKPVTEGKDGAHYAARDAVCFETEDFPDAPNHPNFPDTTLLPDQPYSSTTIYRFDLAEM